jgi:hypothetical protein
MGANKPGSQGERDISVKTVAQGMPDDSAEPVVPSPCFLLCTGAMGEAFTRHSLRPLMSEGHASPIARTLFAPRECEGMFAQKLARFSVVIACEGGRSSIPETAVFEPKGRGVLDRPVPPTPKAPARPRSQGARRSFSEGGKPSNDIDV